MFVDALGTSLWFLKEMLLVFTVISLQRFDQNPLTKCPCCESQEDEWLCDKKRSSSRLLERKHHCHHPIEMGET